MGFREAKMTDSARNAMRPGALVAVDDLARFAEIFSDLADPGVMSLAWPRRTAPTEQEVRRAIGLEPDNEQPTAAKRSAPDGNAEPPQRLEPPQQPERPSRPEQSAEDTDSGWGEHPDPGDDERLYGDRPPHWDSI
jgi:hypothetical protein